MHELLEFIEDLEMVEVLHDSAREGHIEYLLTKYRNRAEDLERDMERQHKFDFA
jgi:hypothetical protein